MHNTLGIRKPVLLDLELAFGFIIGALEPDLLEPVFELGFIEIGLKLKYLKLVIKLCLFESHLLKAEHDFGALVFAFEVRGASRMGGFRASGAGGGTTASGPWIAGKTGRRLVWQVVVRGC